MADIFFSYKREDRPRVEPLVRLLEREGLKVWWDPDLVAGERFDEVIAEEIDAALCVMVAWSAHSVRAPWVRDEASRGMRRGVLVPMSLDGTEPPLGFGVIHTPDLKGWNGDEQDPRIRHLVADVVGRVTGKTPDVGSHEGADRSALSRRRLLQIGVGAGALLAAGVGGWALDRAVGRPLPPIRTERFPVASVDATGARLPDQTGSAEVFDLPVGNASLPFAIVPGGGFVVGSPDNEPGRRANEGPQQQMQVGPFAIGRTTVTQTQWEALVEASPAPVERPLAATPSSFSGPELPVETISWIEASEFCARLSALTGLTLRLPSEVEWEYACRAHSTTPFHFGPTITSALANYLGTGGAVVRREGDADVVSPDYGGLVHESGAYDQGPLGLYRAGTVPVGTFPPNRFGLHEVHGNVWEHCADVGPVDYERMPDGGTPYTGDGGSHVLRGGSWSHNPAICRSAYRDRMSADNPGWPGRVGLRLVCEI
ncbi:SUMF1/EgtB/PvdO family nonheme iron enzyme [Pseudonocardia sp. NPDC049154]|uniref:SUMF1/EgtB/PvdO family nonheme iron enzyme n=1 Tax=Pseudonocardia sp. NPDC049154 TaxID=3155501 RepID=UPI00340B96AF